MCMTKVSRVLSENRPRDKDIMLECIPSPHEPPTPFVLLIAGAHSPNVTHSYTNTLISLKKGEGVRARERDLFCAKNLSHFKAAENLMLSFKRRQITLETKNPDFVCGKSHLSVNHCLGVYANSLCWAFRHLSSCSSLGLGEQYQ